MVIYQIVALEYKQYEDYGFYFCKVKSDLKRPDQIQHKIKEPDRRAKSRTYGPTATPPNIYRYFVATCSLHITQ